MTHYLKRHRLQMSLPEIAYIEGRVQGTLKRYFAEGGEIGRLDHAKERMDSRYGYELSDSKIKGILSHGIIEEVREITADNGVKDFRVSVRSKYPAVHGTRHYVVIYSMTYHHVVTSYARSVDYAYEDRIGQLENFRMPSLYPGDRKK